MSGETTLTITIIGNLTAEPELRFTPSGAAVANFTVASTPRRFNAQTSQWEDGDTLFMRCSIWRQAAENVAESLTKGTRVIVSGRLHQRSYDTKEGEKRTVVELAADEIGPSLKYATTKVAKVSRSNGDHTAAGAGTTGGERTPGPATSPPRPTNPRSDPAGAGVGTTSAPTQATTTKRSTSCRSAPPAAYRTRPRTAKTPKQDATA